MKPKHWYYALQSSTIGVVAFQVYVLFTATHAPDWSKILMIILVVVQLILVIERYRRFKRNERL